MIQLYKKAEVILGVGLCAGGVATYIHKKNRMASSILFFGGILIGTYGSAEPLNSEESEENDVRAQMSVIKNKIKGISYSKGAILFGGTLATCGSFIAIIANPIDTKIVGGAITLASCGLIYSALGYLSKDLNHLISAIDRLNSAMQSSSEATFTSQVGDFSIKLFGGNLICFFAGIAVGVVGIYFLTNSQRR